MADDLMRLNGLAPTTMEEAALFAERYLEPQKLEAYLEHHRQGGTLWDWYVEADDTWQETIFNDNLCVPSGCFGLPYSERLEAIAKERMRFDAWRKEREAGDSHVC